MKLQTLTVIFIIIMLPITMVVSQYIQTEISTINKQAQYDTILNNATYDAMKAFQLNESNSSTSNIPTEKIRDVEASVNSFYNSMSSGMGVAGYTKDDLQGYIPCLVYTLYDGYYIYTKNSDGNYILKPYVYYTEQVGNYTVSYTLDSYITVTGVDTNGNAIAYSGYLYSGNHDITQNEKLEENIEFNGKVESLPYIYKKFNETNGQSIKYYKRGTKYYSYGTAGKLIEETNQTRIIDLDNSFNLGDESARKYCEESKNITYFVSKELSGLTNSEGKKATYLKISSDNDPDNYSSAFNEHRREIIQKSIKSNLEATLFNYNGGGTNGTFEFKTPELDETEWDKIINNVSLITFMQGLPLKNKYYRGYSVVTNTQSKEFVDPDEIYILTKETAGKVYHKITWRGFDETATNTETAAYRNVDFRRKTYTGLDDDGITKIEKYYYPQRGTADYESIVASTNVYGSTQEAISELETGNGNAAIKAYYTALYRERYANYKSLNFGFPQP